MYTSVLTLLHVPIEGYDTVKHAVLIVSQLLQAIHMPNELNDHPQSK